MVKENSILVDLDLVFFPVISAEQDCIFLALLKGFKQRV